MRLQKFMAKAGVASRRRSEELILKGLVSINGEVVTELGIRVDPDKDRVLYDGKRIGLEKDKVYILLHKPLGYVSSLRDDRGRKLVTDLIVGVNERIYPVGRLDIDTRGLLILTNDGDVTLKLTHPSYEISKTYIAVVEGTPNRRALESFRNGLMLDGQMTSPAQVKILKSYDEDSILEIKLHEGRNRQVKRMCEKINHPVKKLKRISMGEIELGGLRPGQWRFLNEEEIQYLKSL